MTAVSYATVPQSFLASHLREQLSFYLAYDFTIVLVSSELFSTVATIFIPDLEGVSSDVQKDKLHAYSTPRVF